MNATTTKLAGAEKFGVTIKTDTNLDRKAGATAFPKKLATAKKNIARLKRK